MHNLLQDVHFGLRILRKSPGFALVAITTLALGIGANSVMFGAVHAFLLRPFTFREPDRLVTVWEKNPRFEGFVAERVHACLKNYLEWRSQATVFQDMAAYEDGSIALTGVPKPQQLEAEKVSPNFFDMLGVRALQGVTFAGDDGTPGKDHLVVLSHEFYVEHFGRNTNMAEKYIELNGQSYSIIGVLPSSFKLPARWAGLSSIKPQIFLPLNVSPHQSGSALNKRSLLVFARLKPGVTLERAGSEMNVIGKRLQEKYPALNEGFGVNVFSLRAEDMRPDLQLGLLVLQGFVGLVLLITCANLANLLMARAAGREKELAVRSALGASRGRIIGQIMVESAVLSVCGGGAGLLLANWGMLALNRFTPQNVLGTHELSVDFSVFAFTFAMVAFAALLFGIIPALSASRPNINESLTRNSRAVAGGSGKIRSALVVMEVAVSVLLVAGAGLMLRSLLALHKVNLGFDPDHVLTASIKLPPEKYSNPEQIRALCSQLLENAKAIPGVESIALASYLPMDDVWETSFTLEDRPESDTQYLIADYSYVSEDYFSTLRTPILRGRAFTRQEAEQAVPNVAIVNESMARKFWPNQDPLGKVILLDYKHHPHVIVGVVADFRQIAPNVPSHTEMFFPGRSIGDPSILLRTAGDPEKLAHVLTAQVLSIDKGLPVNKIRSLMQLVADSTSEQRFGASLMIAFAALALVLASVGLYGVLAYLVSQRTAEIGIRMALGAERIVVLRMVLRQGLFLALTGVLIGIGAALATTHVMSGLLFGVTARDPLTFVATSVILILVATIATFAPAWRATRVDPMVALRYE